MTRRDLMKTSLSVPAAMVAAESAFSEQAEAQTQSAPVPAPGGGRERLLLDFGWRFHLGNANEPAKDFNFGLGRTGTFQKTGNFLPAGNLAFDDGDWSAVNLPHDWAIELQFENDPALASKGFYPLGRTYPATSVGWYRRVLEIPAADAGKRINLEFDGSYRETMVVFNGFYIGRHSGGYDPFSFDVTDFVIPGGKNVVLVRVDATSSDGWFYEGAGIYRHVWLVKTNPVHVKRWGTFVSAEVKPGEAALSIRTEVENSSVTAQDARVISTVLDPAGKEVGKVVTALSSVAPGDEQTYKQQLTVKRPQLWSLEERNLYTLVTEVRAGGDIVDSCETPFGIREVKFDAEKGFFLNGKSVKLKGTCNHQDHAGVGAAVPDAVQYYRIRKLQEMGCNSLRTSHNPPTAELLNACDELGMLVFDETRMMSSNPEGLNQFENLVRRDRNHPSVFMWSMGNEEGQANTDTGLHILTAMKAVANKHDGSRPVSIAPIHAIGVGGLGGVRRDGLQLHGPWRRGLPQRASREAGHRHGDCERRGHARHLPLRTPTRAMSARTIPYTTSRPRLLQRAGGASAMRARGWPAAFIWTGFDYRGEPSPYGWPNISSQYGIIDMCGFPKDSVLLLPVLVDGEMPVLHVFPHWNWPGLEGQGNRGLGAFQSGSSVELFLNGQSLGAKDMKKDSHLAWNVKYTPGTIEARGFKDGKQVLTAKRETAGPAAKLVLTADRTEISADGEDVAMFAVEVQDAEGRTVATADNEVSFRLSGEGRVMGVGNGDPTNHEPDTASSRKAFCGLCMAVVQSSKTAGSITVEASSPGLASASVTISSKAARLRPQVAMWEREAPAGSGITGLWRTGASQIFTFRQDGSALTGTVEGVRGDTPIAIQDGKVDGSKISFTAGNMTYTGTLQGEAIELQRSGGGPPRRETKWLADADLAIGPPPDGSDPSNGAFVGLSRGPQGAATLVLHRAKR
jgi:beta-galactosidase